MPHPSEHVLRKALEDKIATLEKLKPILREKVGSSTYTHIMNDVKRIAEEHYSSAYERLVTRTRNVAIAIKHVQAYL